MFRLFRTRTSAPVRSTVFIFRQQFNQLYSSKNFDSNIKTHTRTHKHTQETRTQTYAHKQQKLDSVYKQCTHNTLLRLADITQ